MIRGGLAMAAALLAGAVRTCFEVVQTGRGRAGCCEVLRMARRFAEGIFRHDPMSPGRDPWDVDGWTGCAWDGLTYRATVVRTAGYALFLVMVGPSGGPCTAGAR